MRNDSLKRAVSYACILSQLANMPTAYASTTLSPTALPTDPNVTAGNASVTTSGADMTINQSSQKAIINWGSFDIGEQASVTFNQPSSSSQTLNRVNSADPSLIYGRLTANGQVFLINPSGVIFGQSARVDVGALVASTKNLADKDFLNDNGYFSGAGTGSVVNNGTITAASSGYVALIGAVVENGGSIGTQNGKVILAAGDTVGIPLNNSGLVSLNVTPASVNASVTNNANGLIVADNGQVYMAAEAADGLSAQVLNEGRVKATTITMDGGSNSNGTVLVTGNGKLDASSTDSIGGSVVMTGYHVGLFDNAAIDVSGATGGGSVRLGGDLQGSNETIYPWSDAVVMDSQTTIDASAKTEGDGGQVILWSRSYTGFLGSITANGGANGGSGGMVETSSHAILYAFGLVTAAAVNGTAGTWLLDPTDVTIVSGSASLHETEFLGVWTPSTDTAQIGVNSINADLNAGTSVTINTISLGTAEGNIVLDSDATISKTSGINVTLTMNAEGNITLNGDIVSTYNKLTLDLNADGSVGGSGNIDTNGGLVSVDAGSGSGTLSGIISGSGGIVKSGNGTLVLSGDNTYSGNTVVNDGTLTMTGSLTPDVTTGTQFIVNNGTLNFESGTYSFYADGYTEANEIGDGIGTNATVNISGATVNIYTETSGTNGSINLGCNGGTGTLNVTSGQLNLPGRILMGAGAIGSDGTLTISGGEVNIGTDGTGSGGNPGNGLLWFGLYSNTVNLDGGTLTLWQMVGGDNYELLTIGSTTVNFNGGTLQAQGSSTRIDYVNGVTYNIEDGGLIFDTQGYDTAFVSNINGVGTGGLKKLGSGSLALYGTNTYSGTTELADGTLIAEAYSSIGSGGDITFTGGTLQYVSSNTGDYSSRIVNSTGAISIDTNGLDVSFLSDIVSSNIGGLTKLGDGTLSLTDAVYTGATAINAGTLQALSTSSFGNLSAVTIASGASLDLNGNSNTIGSLAGAGTVTSSGGTAVTLTTGGDGTSTLFSGVMQDGTSQLCLAKSGNGTFTLTGDNTYTGTTTINSGTLQIGTGSSGSLASATIVDNGSLIYDVDSALTLPAINGTGSLSASTSSTLTFGDTVSLTGADSTIFGTGTTLTLDSDSSLAASGSGTAITLVGSRFINNAGSDALSAPDGNWQVWSSNPSPFSGETQDDTDGLEPDFIQYDAVYGSTAVLGTGNGLLYEYAPTLSVTLTGVASKVYDGTTAATLTSANFSVSGTVNGDSVATYPTSGVYDNANVGTGKTVTVDLSSLVLQNGSASVYGYDISSSVSASIGIITKATLTITPNAASMTYDASTLDNADYSIDQTNYAITGWQGSDTASSTNFTLTGSIAFNGSTSETVRNAGTYALTEGTLAGTESSGNYSATFDNPASNAYVITPLTITAVYLAADKTYNASQESGVTPDYAASGVITGDSVTFSYSSALVSDKNVGTDKAVTISGISISGGEQAANYELSSSTAAATADITPASLTVSGVTANDKTYDATVSAILNVNSATLSGIFSGDVVSLDSTSASGTFADKAVGTDKAVTATGFTIDGSDAGNYTLTQPSGLAADITPASITFSVADTQANTGETPTVGAVTLTGVIAGDQVGSVVTVYDSSDDAVSLSSSLPAGTYTEIVTSLTGADVSNYVIASSGNSTGTLTINQSTSDQPAVTYLDTTYQTETQTLQEEHAVTNHELMLSSLKNIVVPEPKDRLSQGVLLLHDIRLQHPDITEIISVSGHNDTQLPKGAEFDRQTGVLLHKNVIVSNLSFDIIVRNNSGRISHQGLIIQVMK